MKDSMNNLFLSLKTDPDGTGEFVIALSLNGYSGVGSCCVNIQNILKEAKKFGEFPLSGSDIPCIEGGYLKEDMSGLLQTHLRLSAVPSGSKNMPKLHVELASPLDGATDFYAATLSCDFQVSYGCLNDLAEAMRMLVENDGGEYTVNLYR